MSDVYSTSDVSGLQHTQHPHMQPERQHHMSSSMYTPAVAPSPGHGFGPAQTPATGHGFAPSQTPATGHGQIPNQEDDVVRIIHHRRKSTIEALRKQQEQLLQQQQLQQALQQRQLKLQQQHPLDDDLVDTSPGKVQFDFEDQEESNHSTVKDSDIELGPIKESVENASQLGSVANSPKAAFVTYMKEPPGTSQRGQKSLEAEEPTENSQLIPRATLDTMEDLKLKKENEKPDALPRSISVVGENVSKDLKLAQEQLDPRTRTNSEGPSMGMEKRNL
jgi:type II secretory pathway pseudopilin PulG